MPGPGPQDFIFQHPPKPEGDPEGDIKKYQKIHVKISTTMGTWLEDSSSQHLLDPEAGPEGGIRKCQ